jgi:hypothetical protein
MAYSSARVGLQKGPAEKGQFDPQANEGALRTGSWPKGTRNLPTKRNKILITNILFSLFQIPKD